MIFFIIELIILIYQTDAVLGYVYDGTKLFLLRIWEAVAGELVGKEMDMHFFLSFTDEQTHERFGHDTRGHAFSNTQQEQLPEAPTLVAVLTSTVLCTRWSGRVVVKSSVSVDLLAFGSCCRAPTTSSKNVPVASSYSMFISGTVWRLFHPCLMA